MDRGQRSKEPGFAHLVAQADGAGCRPRDAIDAETLAHAPDEGFPGSMRWSTSPVLMAPPESRPRHLPRFCPGRSIGEYGTSTFFVCWWYRS